MSVDCVLCVDIGNTNTVFGVYRQDTLVQQWRIATDAARMPDEYAATIVSLLMMADIHRKEISGVAISSVVPSLTTDFAKLSKRYFEKQAIILDAKAHTGLTILYEDPRQVGADRIANAVAAKVRYTMPACVVGFGTATTFDAIDADGAYVGGAIAPGLVISSEALFARAARLIKVDLRRPPAAIGRTTEQSVQSGLLFGYAGLVEGIVARFRKELGVNMKVIATGGLAEIVAAETPVIEVVDPSLTLDGLYIIYKMNVGEG